MIVRKRLGLLTGLMIGFATLVARAPAAEPIEGYFVARSACPAFESFRKGTNPGAVVTEIDRAYPLLEGNAPRPSHFRIRIKDAAPQARWVLAECGEHVVAVDTLLDRLGTDVADVRPGNDEGARDAVDALANQDTPPDQDAETFRDDYVLALSWQPAFCEQRPETPECVSQTAMRRDADHFSLHGLWPQPIGNFYCEVRADVVATDENGLWEALPNPDLSDGLRARLAKAMPGTQSFLDRHEWVKHGSCYPASAEEYYEDSLLLLDQINDSDVRELFAERLGRPLTLTEIQDAFDQAFGAGAGERVRLSCRADGERQLIGEVRLHLGGEIGPSAEIGPLMRAAPEVRSECDGGIVDRVGLQ